MHVSYLTASLPGTGGRLRARDEDFVVEELAAYEPAGEGDHLHLRVEKRGITTHEAALRIANALSRHPRDIGYAGLKDAHAVSVQTFSVEHVTTEQVAAAFESIRGLRLLDGGTGRRHRNKLKLGHLRGNRFTITIRDVCDDASARARAVLDVLSAVGTPNWFGEQRFGSRGDNDAIGRLLVLGDLDGACDGILGPSLRADAGNSPTGDSHADGDPRMVAARTQYAAGNFVGALDAMPGGMRVERRMLDDLIRGRAKRDAVVHMPKPLLRLLVSAYQSALFNELLAARMPNLGAVEAGDLAFLHDRGAVFSVLDPAVEQPRADRFEISASVPLFGTDTLLADGEPGRRERAVLAREGIEPAQFRVAGAGEMSGERRPVRIPVSDATVSEARVTELGAAIEVAFSLPRGAYATAVLAEIMKPAL